MVAYKNFYETIQEARMRLKGTVVKYKDDFYYVLEITDHSADGKFRIYMDELGHYGVGRDRIGGFPSMSPYDGCVGKSLDKFLEKNPDCGMVRKYADSKHFEKFRPFPLGNVNTDGCVVYTERGPTRSTLQGLSHDSVLATRVESVPPRYDPHGSKVRWSLSSNDLPIGNAGANILSPEFYAMLKGEYPSYQEVVENLQDPEITNMGCAFHRDYSVLRGPIGTLFLCYKHSGVGFIDTDENKLTISRDHEFLIEEISELGIFSGINIKEVRSND